MSKKFIYVAEFLLPTNNAYSIHVLKMCDNSIYHKYKCNLIIPQNNCKFKLIKKNYNLRNNFKIFSLFQKINRLNFILRIIFGIYAAFKIRKEKPNLVITRSFVTSFILSLIKYHHFLEIHGDIKSFTRFIFLKLNFINSKFIIKNIFITKNLAQNYHLKKSKYIVLPDAVDKKDFSKFKFSPIKKIENFYYTGSFFKGKGIELIIKISKIFTNKNFYIYGNKKFLEKKKLPKNILAYNYVAYSKIPKILNNADVLLMPYSANVFYNSNAKDNIGRFHSPLKMFDYLASGKLILSSNQKVLKEILVDKSNCILVKKNNIKYWVIAIKYAINNLPKINTIAKNALNDSNKFTWINRIKIISNINLNYIGK
jgi:glycosyltransferase involved in cell wall biosynthesis